MPGVAAAGAAAWVSCSPAKLALVSFTIVNTMMKRATAPTMRPVSAAPRSEDFADAVDIGDW